jgi:hypothetical protein
MNIIVDRPQLVRAVLLYLDLKFSDLQSKVRDEFPNQIIYFNSQKTVLLLHMPNDNKIWADSSEIVILIQKLFFLRKEYILKILKIWIEKKLGIKNANVLSNPVLSFLKIK